jgi:hypothetical protein
LSTSLLSFGFLPFLPILPPITLASAHPIL